MTVESLTQQEADTEFNVNTAKAIDVWCQHYGRQFEQSSVFSALPKTTQTVARYLITEFTWHLYRFRLEKPGHWTTEGIRLMLTHWLPKEWIETETTIKSLVPALSAFLSWLETEKLIADSAPLILAVKQHQATLLARYSDRNFAEPMKFGRMQMREAGHFIATRPPISSEELEIRMTSFDKLHNTGPIEVPKHCKLRECTEADLKRYPTLESVIEALQQASSEFPEAAILVGLQNKVAFSERLLMALDHAVQHYHNIADNDTLHIFALFILAQLRDTRAYPKMMAILNLPEGYSKKLLGDLCNGYDTANIIASTYNGDITLLQDVLHNTAAHSSARIGIFESMVGLAVTGTVERNTIVNYFHEYLNANYSSKPKEQLEFVSLAGSAALDLNDETLYPVLKDKLMQGEIDTGHFDLSCLAEHIHDERSRSTSGYHFIEDVKATYGSWYSFNDSTEMRMPAHATQPSIKPVIPASSDKVGRNDPCPCGSGKKFKKCCLH